MDLGKELNEALAAPTAKVARDNMVGGFSVLAVELGQTLQEQRDQPEDIANPAGYAVCLENIPNYKTVRAIIDVFEQASTVGVFTTFGLPNAGQEVIDLFRLAGGTHRHIIELGPLTPQETGMVIEQRCMEGIRPPLLRPPFETADIEQTLGQQPRSLGELLLLMAKIVDVKLTEDYFPVPWPKTQIAKLMEIL